MIISEIEILKHMEKIWKENLNGDDINMTLLAENTYMDLIPEELQERDIPDNFFEAAFKISEKYTSIED